MGISFAETRHALSLHSTEHESLKLGEWIERMGEWIGRIIDKGRMLIRPYRGLRMDLIIHIFSYDL
jgi:hypothetical protein